MNNETILNILTIVGLLTVCIILLAVIFICLFVIRNVIIQFLRSKESLFNSIVVYTIKNMTSDEFNDFIDSVYVYRKNKGKK